jgi:hypothetical protein
MLTFAFALYSMRDSCMTGWSHQPIFLFMISKSFATPLIIDGRGKYIKILCNHRAVAYGCGRSKMVACCCISENTQLANGGRVMVDSEKT